MRGQKGPPDEIVEDLKTVQNNVVTIGLTIECISSNLRFLNFTIFLRENIPGPA